MHKKYPEHWKHRAPQINLPYYKTDISILKFYSTEDLCGPRRLASCKECGKEIEYIMGSNAFSSYTSILKCHLQAHPKQFQLYLDYVAANVRPDIKTKYDHYIQMENRRMLSEQESDQRHDEIKRNEKCMTENVIEKKYIENDFNYFQNNWNKDGENARILQYIYHFTNRNVSLPELIGKWHVGASFKKYRRYKCLVENDGNITLDLERLFCENTCFLDPENFDSCPNSHKGDISIFGERSYQQKVNNLDAELEKYPEFQNDKSFDHVAVKHVRCVEKDNKALREMNRLLKIILSMIIVKKDTLKRKVEEIFEKNTSENKLTKPHFAIQLWGPKFTAFDERDNKNTCDFDDKLFYTYQHVNNEDCPAYHDGSKIKHREPWMEDGVVMYPCNIGGCGEPCGCQVCNSLAGDKVIECENHSPDHHGAFNPEEDITICRRLFFKNNKSPKYERPKQNTFWRPLDLKLAGMKNNCLVCKTLIEDHLKNHHSLNLHAKFCQICGYLELISRNSMVLACYICKKKFLSTYRLDDHMNTHNSDNPFSCENCDENFPTKFVQQRHQEEIHGDGQTDYSCEMCGFTSSFERNLKRHIRDNHSEQTIEFLCTICDTKFNRQDTLSRHTREAHCFDKRTEIFKGVNDGDISFQCEICQQTFKRKDKLNRHKRTVHDELDVAFGCQKCGKSFNRKDNLKRHNELAHSQLDDVFSCEKCHMEFNRHDNLKRHERTLCNKPE